ncbi:MAG: hypothetical protein QN121_07630 [Armatimonadota bacterium]|nr:hypothetical protein [Armatimonadota bacterium]
MWRLARFFPPIHQVKAWARFPKYVRWRLALYGFTFPGGRLSLRKILSRRFLRAVWEYHRWLGEMDQHLRSSWRGRDTGGGR